MVRVKDKPTDQSETAYTACLSRNDTEVMMALSQR